MISYSVDASVYALPDIDKSSGEEINDYLLGLVRLGQLIKREDIRVYLFYADFKLLINNKALPDVDKINRLRSKAASKNYDPKRVISGFTSIIREALQSRDKASEKHVTRTVTELFFDNWFHLKNIEIANAKIETDGSGGEICNETIPACLARNMSIIALLNKFVYRDIKKHMLIVNKKSFNFNTFAVKISSTVKNITTDPIRDRSGHPLENRGNYVMPGIPSEEILLEDEKVGIRTLDDIGSRKFSDIFSAFEAARKDFSQDAQNFIIGEDVKEGLMEYYEELECQELSKKDAGKAEYMANTLYAHLEALNDFVIHFRENANTLNQYKLSNIPNPHYCGSPGCQFFNICKSFIYLLGVRCSDENQKQLEGNKKIYNERMRGNGKGEKELFRIHLKPHSEPCFSNVFFLTLRIYFKWNAVEKKMVIGWLGRHLYLPIKCPPFMTSCWRWKKGCPANHAHK